MATPLKAVSHAPKDIHILGGESLVYRVAACGGDSSPNVSIRSVGAVTSYTFDEVSPSADYGARVTSTSYGALVDHSIGEVKLRATATGKGFAPNSVTNTLYVFDAIEDANVIEVTDDSEFAAAIATVNAGSDNHYLISLASGSYNLSTATATPLSRRGVLLSIEPDNNAIGQVTVSGKFSVTAAAYLSWRSVRFDGQGSGTAYEVADKTVQVIRNSWFVNADIGMSSSRLASSRAVSCHVNSSSVGFVGVDILRSCSGAGVATRFAVDCGVVDGCLITTGSAEDHAIYYSSGYVGSYVVTNNTLVDQGPSGFLLADVDTKSCIIKGNVYSGQSSSPVVFKSVFDTAIAHNTIHTADTGDSVKVTAGARNLRSVNNWLYPLTRTALKMTQFDSVWSNNATESTINFKGTLTGLAYPFSNNYMFLKKRTPLRTDGMVGSVLFSQGAKVQPGQIGALPYTSDTDLTSVHKSVYERPFFGFSGPAPSTN